MLLIDPDGLFNGDRLRRCSNIAQLHWPRLFLASDGFGRLEINYARIIGHAYPTFSPVPSETEIQSYLQEYARNFLIFLYHVDGRIWGHWDVPHSKLLPRFKTAADHRSPQPPEKEFTAWKRRYREQNKSFPKSLGNPSEEFPCAVAVADVKTPFPEKAPGESGLFDINDPSALKPETESEPEGFSHEPLNGKSPNGHCAGSGRAPNIRTIIDQVAAQIHQRHPSAFGRRDCSVTQVAKRLAAILKHQRIPAASQEAYLRQVDRNHAAMCSSEGWQKDGGQFAKGLENWLAPAKERYATAVESAAAPAIEKTGSVYSRWEPPAADA